MCGIREVSTSPSTDGRSPPTDFTTAQMISPQQCEIHVTPEDQMGPFTLPGQPAHMQQGNKCPAAPSPACGIPVSPANTQDRLWGYAARVCAHRGRMSHPKDTKGNSPEREFGLENPDY